MTNKPAKAKPYRLGKFDPQCRYPVIVGEATIIGYVSRWHREWDTVSSAGDHRVGRPPVGESGAEYAAQWLYDQYEAGLITSIPADDIKQGDRPYGPAPLLDHRMPDTPANRAKALEVYVDYDKYRWRPVSGYPGSDNHQLLQCLLCDKTVGVYRSHQRGRNGNPPSPHRHPGCLDEATVRRLIPAYNAKPKPKKSA